MRCHRTIKIVNFFARQKLVNNLGPLLLSMFYILSNMNYVCDAVCGMKRKVFHFISWACGMRKNYSSYFICFFPDFYLTIQHNLPHHMYTHLKIIFHFIYLSMQIFSIRYDNFSPLFILAFYIFTILAIFYH